MTYGYGEPGSPSPDGEPDEWNQSFRTPRPGRRDGYPPAGPQHGNAGYGGDGYGEPAYGDPGYPDPGYGAPASGPAYGGSTYGAPASGPAYGAPASGPAYGAPASGPAYGAPGSGAPQGRDYRDQGYGEPAYGEPDGRHPVPQPRYGQPGYQQPGYPQPGYQQPGYGQQPGPQQPGYGPDSGYPSQGRGAGPGHPPGAYQASGYPAAPPRGGQQTYGGPDGGWNDQQGGGYPPQGDYRSQQGYGAPNGYPPAGRRPASMDYGRPAAEIEDEEPPRKRGGKVLYSLLTIVIVAAIGGIGYKYFIQKDATSPRTVTSSTPAKLPATDPILSQKTDPKALTAAEVFSKATIRSSATGGDYTVAKSQAITGCTGVATTKIQSLLSSLGCTQAVRANLLSPDGRYTITAGILNLPDEKSAATVRTSINALVTGGKDHFNAYVATSAAAPQPTTHLGWDSRGHYVFYVVIGLASGQPITSSDERTPLIISDIIETYLSGKVVGAREKAPAASPTK